jgi:hypothetical protein
VYSHFMDHIRFMDSHSLASLRESFRPDDQTAFGSVHLDDARALAEAVLNGDAYALSIARKRDLVTPSFPGSQSTRVTPLEGGQQMRTRALMMQSFAPLLQRSPDESKTSNEYGHNGPKALSAITMFESCRAMIKVSGHGDEQVKLFGRHLDDLESQYTSMQDKYWEDKDEEEESENKDKAAESTNVGDTSDDEQGPQPDWFQKSQLGIDLRSIHTEMCKRVSQTIFPCSD